MSAILDGPSASPAASPAASPVAAPVPPAGPHGPATAKGRYLWAAFRLSLAWRFLWPFLDKLFGLGHETSSAKAWIHGGSPTTGFLKGAVGPFAGLYHSMPGALWADWGFMLGLLCIGLALLLGVGMRIAAGNTIGFGRRWTSTALVGRHPWLR